MEGNFRARFGGGDMSRPVEPDSAFQAAQWTTKRNDGVCVQWGRGNVRFKCGRGGGRNYEINPNFFFFHFYFILLDKCFKTN